MSLRFIFLVVFLSHNGFANPNIVVSIQPIYSLVNALTQGVTTPKLLLKTNQSVHHSQLKPSQLSMLFSADLVVIMHPEFESTFDKTLKSIPFSKKFIINTNNNTRHSWLEIERMQVFAKQFTQKLGKIDKTNADIYQKNLAKLSQQLKQLKSNIAQQLAPYKTNSIAVYSDALKYFVQSNNLQKPTVINKSHTHKLSIYKIRTAKKTLQKNQTKCLLSANTVSRKHLGILTEGLDTKVAVIDLVGAQIPLNTQHYFKLMHNISNQVDKCLG